MGQLLQAPTETSTSLGYKRDFKYDNHFTLSHASAAPCAEAFRKTSRTSLIYFNIWHGMWCAKQQQMIGWFDWPDVLFKDPANCLLVEMTLMTLQLVNNVIVPGCHDTCDLYAHTVHLSTSKPVETWITSNCPGEKMKWEKACGIKERAEDWLT